MSLRWESPGTVRALTLARSLDAVLKVEQNALGT
ncbi:hypothetical protein PS645_02784 [Pseudomonas fluorescens]|uniref:Uncharacterized protein n=1 Tax=Pseudomonas fluorescens TaxID=294 RepID=A0A5E6TCN3_PSEFL|nr:hypothetical protein PS645_02784 [Pseudomonas fluorescens]